MKSKTLVSALRQACITALILLATWTSTRAATTNSWLLDADGGTWNNAANWDPAGVPNGPESKAILTNPITASRLITSDVNVTLGSLEIGPPSSSFNLTITNEPGTSWKLDNGGQGVLVREIGPGTSTTGDRLWMPIEIAEDLAVYSAAKAVTFSGPITESGGSRQIVKTGSGYLTLASEQNAFTGGVTVKAGNLNAVSSSSTGSRVGTGVITLGDTSGSAGAGVIGNGNYTNSIVVVSGSTGTKIVRNSATGGNLNLYGPITLNDNAELNAGSSTGYVYARGEISGGGALVITSQAGRQATNYVRLGGANTFTGGVTLKTGNLRIQGHEVIGSIGGTDLNLTYSIGTGTLTINTNTILSSDGNGNRVLTNAVVVTGDFTIGHTNGGAGTLRLSGPMDLGSDTRTISLGSTVGHYILGPISGTAGFIKKGTQALSLYGANSFSGGLTVSQGNVAFDGNAAFGTGLLTMGESSSTGSIQVTGNGTVTNDVAVVAGVSGSRVLGCTNNGTATFSGNITLGTDLVLGAASATYPRTLVVSGSISGTGSLLVSGAQPNSVTLSGANTFDGTTTIGGGTLFVANTAGSATSLGAVTVTNGILAGTGMLGGATTIGTGGTLAPGVNGLGLLTINNALTFAGGSTNVMELNKTLGTNDVVVANSVAFNGTLVATNLAGDLAAGDSFKLFRTTAQNSGAFTEVVIANSTLKGQFDPVTGILSILSGMADYPTNISFSFTGGQLLLTWPETHHGWLAQSNSVDLVDSASWFPIAGSDAGTSLTITVDPASPKVFYRLVKP